MAHIARRLPPELLPEALELTRRVFLEFEGPDYPPEGVEEFLRFLEDRETLAGLAFWGSFLEGKLTGVLAAREGHICLLFVDRDHHRQGAARALVEACTAGCSGPVTVNSSPYGAEAYRRLGFVDTDGMQFVNGMYFIPMKREGQAQCDLVTEEKSTAEV